MKHLGDITKINGAEIEIVDCITGGSPCQDLSVAGKRAGLAGERSGLFMEQIRIVKEMREHDRQLRRSDHTIRSIRPRYMVWENVPGAFSSNGGKDFQSVLTEIARIVNPEAPDVPLSSRGGWSKSGCIMGYGADGCPFSIAWRLHNAKFWGCAQRRKRIALVADFGGTSASEILFERKSVSGNFEQGGAERKEIAAAAGSGIDGTGEAVTVYNGENITSPQNAANPSPGDPCHTLGTDSRNYVVRSKCLNPQDVQRNHIQHDKAFCIQGNCIDRSDTAGCNGKGWTEDVSYTLNTVDRPAVYQAVDLYNGTITGDVTSAITSNTGTSATHTGPTVMKMDVPLLNDQGGSVMEANDKAKVSPTLRAEMHGNIPAVIQPTMIEMTSTKNTIVEDGVSPTLTARMGTGGNQVNAVCCMDVGFFQSCEEEACTLLARQYKDPPLINHENGSYQKTVGALCSSGYNKLGTQEAANDMYITGGNIVRRLTPKECERLQGFPDDWTNIGEWIDSKGKKHKDSDSPRYKALGNSIAVGYANNGSGFWMWLLKRISAQYERNATLGSLFDGIGGFPLAWEHYNGKGSARWASEIEEFPIAVTKRHFPED